MRIADSTLFSDTKKHYIILDGLRGVAAVVVVMFHLLETFAGGSNLNQIINHGYMAVDFFFVLSGFVIGYAYDDRWNKMNLTGFFKRRLIRLHPMIIIGMTIGALLFYFQDSPFFPGINEVPVWKMILVMLIGYTLLPVPPSLDIRGWAEMHPLNGPAWSLFLEYVANILYALILRKLSNKILAVLVFLAGALLLHLAVTSPHGDIIGGWSIEPAQLRIGFTRLLFPFLAGLLLARISKPGNVKHAFLWCSLLLVIVLSIPRIGGSEHLWLNGLYDAVIIIFVFPLIVYLGASGKVEGVFSLGICKFLGDISFPLYIIHYPFIYVFMRWTSKNHISLTEALPVAFIVLLLTVNIAFICVKFFDEPVRKWLTGRFMPGVSKQK